MIQSHVIIRWFRKYFSDPQAIILAVLLLTCFAIVFFFGQMLAPLLSSIVIAYLLEGPVGGLQGLGLRRIHAVVIVYLGFLALVLLVLLGLMPLLSNQFTQFAHQLPDMVSQGQKRLLHLPEKYSFISQAQVGDMMQDIRSAAGTLGQNIVSWSLASITGILVVGVYVVLVPVLVFFFLKDKDLLLSWVMGFLPRERQVVGRVWEEMSRQIGNYVRGKFIEIVFAWVVTFVVFAALGLQFAMLLSVLVGVSVIVPFIGAIAATIPVVLVAYFQWGWGTDFATLVIAYAIIQLLDGNVLVPLLFSKTVNLHPVGIIASVLVFGGLWGFWGVFFAIPLATLVTAVMHAWPRADDRAQTPDPGPQKPDAGRPAADESTP